MFKLIRQPWPGILKWLPIYGLFLLIGWLRLDPDFGWHLQAGNYFREHGIPDHDPFSYTAPQFDWINHEWASDILVSWLHQLGGYGLLVVIYTGLWTTAFWLVGHAYLPAGRQGRQAGRRVHWAILLTAVVAVLPYAGVRATVWTVLFFALLLSLQGQSLQQGLSLQSHLQSQRRWIKFFIPILFMVWANLHGGFVIGLVYLAYLAIRQRSPTKISAKFQAGKAPWLIILVISGLATLINPYGWQLYTEIGRTLFDSSLHNQINEWRPFHILPPSWAYLVLYLSGFWLFGRKKLANWFSFPMLLLAASLSASRNWPLFVVASLSDTNQYWQKIRAMIPSRLDRPRRVVLGLLIGLGAVAVSYGLYVSFRAWQPRDINYPKVAVSYLTTHGCPGQLFNDYNYGGYLIWQLPNQKVFIDGRMPSWRDEHGQKYLEDYYKVLNNPSYRKRALAKHDIKCVLLSNGRQPQMLADLKKQGWRQAVNANGSSLLIAP